MLGELREGLVPDRRGMRPRTEAPPEDVFLGEFPAEAQRELVAELIGELPFPEGSWRLDPTEHPFAISIGRGDVRLTTRYDESQPGHGAVQRAARVGPRALRGRRRSRAGPDATGQAAVARPARVPEPALGELGRPRPPLPGVGRCRMLRERFPGRFDRGGRRGAGAGRQPGRALADPDRGRRGDLQPPHPDPVRAGAGDLRRDTRARRPARRVERSGTATTSGWRCPTTPTACFRTSTGPPGPSATSPPTASATSSPGSSGPRPRRDLSDLDDRIGAGDLAALGEWLREKVHRHGRRLSPAEVLERAGCGELSVEPLLDHLRSRAELGNTQ